MSQSTTSSGFLTAKSMAQLFIPPIVGVGLVVFKGVFFNGYPIESLPMYVEMGTTAVSFVITDLIGDYLLGATQQNDDNSFSKTVESLLFEPPMFGAMYSVGKELMMPNSLYKVGYGYGMAEGALAYASTRFFSDPIVNMLGN